MRMSTDLLVRAVRFTDDVSAMSDFLVLLGLSPHLRSEGGGWVELHARSGQVALHSAATSHTGATAGETGPSFEVPDADAVCSDLRAAGFDAAVVDESYGRDVVVTDPVGAPVVISERPEDLYGYRRLDGSPLPVASGVVPVRFTDDANAYHRFLAALGLVGSPNPGGWATYAARGGGWVGVHHRPAGAAALPIVGEHGVHLTLAVDPAGLDDLQHRLETAGVAVQRHDEDVGSFVAVTDPDGQRVEVHPTPGA